MIKINYLSVSAVFTFTLFLFFINFAEASKQSLSGKVIFMRHTVAPGVGDPDNFNLKDCRTQRNLSEYGRMQARKIGRKILETGLEFSRIYSSEWCRCVETARLLNLDKVIPFHGLNSFYEDHVPRDQTLEKLREKLKKIGKNSKPVLMVTHFVTIFAITNFGSSPGEMILYDPETNIAERLTL